MNQMKTLAKFKEEYDAALGMDGELKHQGDGLLCHLTYNSPTGKPLISFQFLPASIKAAINETTPVLPCGTTGRVSHRNIHGEDNAIRSNTQRIGRL